MVLLKVELALKVDEEFIDKIQESEESEVLQEGEIGEIEADEKNC